MTDARNLSLLSLTREIVADAREIARLTTSLPAQALANTIVVLGERLVEFGDDLSAGPCDCPVCGGHPDRVVTGHHAWSNVCETAFDDAVFAAKSTSRTLDEQLRLDAEESRQRRLGVKGVSL